MMSSILLVEDNEDDVFAFKWAFKKTQIETDLRVVTDGQRALDYLGAASNSNDPESFPMPALVFLDLKLPYVSGHEILEWMKSKPELQSIPVVILSGSDEERDHELAGKNGAQAYLVKPATPDQLKSLVESLVVTAA